MGEDSEGWPSASQDHIKNAKKREYTAKRERNYIYGLMDIYAKCLTNRRVEQTGVT